MKTAKAPAAPRVSDRYIRHEDFAERIGGVELAPEIWAVFSRLGHPLSAAELASSLRMETEVVQSAIRRLVRRKLIRKHVVSWREYSATTPHAKTVSTTLLETPPAPATVTVGPVSPAPVVPGPLPPASPIISFRIVSDGAPARPAPAISFSLRNDRRPRESRPPLPEPRGLRLRPVIDAIGARAGGGIAGQLLVYRVFLQVPTELMHAAGLHSLSLVDDHFAVSDPAFIAALAESSRTHADLDLNSPPLS